MNAIRLAAAAFLIICRSITAQALPDDDAFRALVAAYPEALLKYENRALHWRDGTITDIGDDQQRPFEQALRGATLHDQLRLPYPRNTLETPPGLNDDPGRFRNLAFFRKMYGNCWQGEVQKNLVPVVWLPKTWNHVIRATSVNGVAEKFTAISNEIEQLPAAIRRAAYPLGGGFTCRAIVDTGQPSMHSYGAALDLNRGLSDYWYWDRRRDGAFAYRNRMPLEIVEIFERHGFIWGGKWYHYDTMHFEYRPELIALARRK